MRHRANMLAPPPPTPEMAESPAYCGLSASARPPVCADRANVIMKNGDELVRVEALAPPEFALADSCATVAYRDPALDAALTELQAGGFILIRMTGRSFVDAVPLDGRGKRLPLTLLHLSVRDHFLRTAADIFVNGCLRSIAGTSRLLM